VCRGGCGFRVAIWQAGRCASAANIRRDARRASEEPAPPSPGKRGRLARLKERAASEAGRPRSRGGRDLQKRRSRLTAPELSHDTHGGQALAIDTPRRLHYTEVHAPVRESLRISTE